jgi:hypothetical protein
MATVPQVDEANAQACGWIEDRAEHGSLVIGEFRDLPVARPSGPNTELAEDVGEAVASGLHYAMLWPFDDAWITKSQYTGYLAIMKDRLMEAYKNLLSHTAAAVIQEIPKERQTDRDFLNSELDKAFSRIRLYYLRQGPDDKIGICEGFASKVFLTRDKGEGFQVWIWVSAEDGEHVLRKRTKETELVALQRRMFPIIDCFDQNGHLPNTDEMDALARDAEFEDQFIERIGEDGQKTRHSYWVERVLRPIDLDRLKQTEIDKFHRSVEGDA